MSRPDTKAIRERIKSHYVGCKPIRHAYGVAHEDVSALLDYIEELENENTANLSEHWQWVSFADKFGQHKPDCHRHVSPMARCTCEYDKAVKALTASTLSKGNPE